MTKKHEQDELDIDKALQQEFTRAENFFNSNRKTILYVLAGLVIGVVGYVGYTEMIQKPAEQEAQTYLSVVQKQFEVDSFNLVVNGNGTDLSALDIIDDFGSTKAGNLAHFYAGRSYLAMGQFEEAVDHLKSFKSDDKIVSSLAMGLAADAQSELGQHGEAADLYMKAALNDDNAMTAPILLKKAGLHYEKAGDFEKAVRAYTRIQEEYKETPEFAEIVKYINRAKARGGMLD
ncbi:MAG: tetratricopeptide repeat protein [Bacteroidetes bacterium]|nr:MAG: tetratricopeptide repeat protein [Bacteroidota bacterium]